MKNRLTNQLAILVSWYPCDAIICLAIYTHNSDDQCEFNSSPPQGYPLTFHQASQTSH